KPFTELTAADWEAVRGVVLDGALYLTRALIASMVKHAYGRILFFTGEGAFIGGSGRAHVSAAKMGLVGLARGLASEFASHNIRVNYRTQDLTEEVRRITGGRGVDVVFENIADPELFPKAFAAPARHGRPLPAEAALAHRIVAERSGTGKVVLQPVADQ